MRRAVTLAEGIAAAEDLASALLGFSVHKAVDPLSPEGFLLIGQKVADKLANAVKGAEAAVIADVIHSLGFDWKKLSPDAATAAMNAVNKAIGDAYAKRVLPKINETLEVEGPKVMGGVKKSVKVRQKLDISGDLAQRDLVAEKAIRNSHVNFIRDSAGDRAATLSKKARSMVATGLGQGLGTDQIGKDLHAFFRENIPRPPSYWRTVADSFVGRARASSQIYAYETAKIQSFQVVAVIDEVTTDQCRFMNGKVFSVTVGRALIESMNALEEPEDVKYAAPWIRKGRDDDGNMRLFVPHSNGTTTTIAKIDRSGVGRADDAGKFSGGKDEGDLGKLGVSLPPYHGRCRTVIVAAAESFGEAVPVMVPGADLEPIPAAPEPVSTTEQSQAEQDAAEEATWRTVEFHEKALKAQYGDAAKPVAWGRAMTERGRLLTLEEFKTGGDELRAIGIENYDPHGFLFVKDLVKEKSIKTVGALQDALLDHPDASNVWRAVSKEIEITSKLIEHRKAIETASIALDATRIINTVDSAATTQQTVSAVDNARKIFEALSHKSIKQPVDYYFYGSKETRGLHNKSGLINLGTGLTTARIEETALHEWGHAIEALNDSRLARAVDYLDARAGTEQRVLLRGSTNEYTRADKLFDEYMGKDYDHVSAMDKQSPYKGRTATEVTSMASQHLDDVMTLAAKVYREDPDSLDFILGQLANQ